MSFVDSIEKKVRNMKEEEYRPQEYQFSDGEGVEEGELMMDDSSEQEGFSEIMSGDDEGFEGKPQKHSSDQDEDDEDFDSEDDNGEEYDEEDDQGDEEGLEEEAEEDIEDVDEEYDEEAEEIIDDDISEDESDDEEEEEEQKVPAKPLKAEKTQATLDNPDIEKAIRSVLNKVSEGYIELMFTSLMEVVKQHVGKGTGKPSLKVAMFAHCYAKIFIQMNIASQ